MTNFNWNKSYQGEALVISSGQLFFKDKKPKGLYLPDVLEMIKADPDKKFYSKVVERRKTLAECVRDNDLDSLGEVKGFYSSINLINLQTDRIFPKLPQSGGDLLENKYDSEPKEIK